MCKSIFSNKEKANGFFDYLLNISRGLYEEKSRVEVDFKNNSGFKIPSTKRSAFLLKKDNVVIIANGENEKDLEKVVRWFIEKY